MSGSDEVQSEGMMESGGVAIYSIGAVERMAGVSAATLRNWEERYGVIRPERSRGGHRLYTRDHVEQLRFVAARLEEGLHPADAHRLLRDRLARPGAAGLLGAGEGKTALLILLAERDPYAAEFAEFFLRTEGYEVMVALDAAEAVRLFEERPPQLAVVELLISGGVGGELCRRLKAGGVAACLAVSSLEARDEALGLGADAFLRKPLDPLRFVSTVKDLLGTSAYLSGPLRALA